MEGGYFDKLYNGDTGFLTDAGVFKQLTDLLLCKIDEALIPHTELPDIVSCQVTLNYRLISKSGKQEAIGVFSVIGPGLSEEEALSRGIELLIEKHSKEILNGVLPNQ